MKQTITTNHSLQMRQRYSSGEWSVWSPALAPSYHDARRLAEEGHLASALRTAGELHVQNYGTMLGVEFQCVTICHTVTSNFGDGRI